MMDMAKQQNKTWANVLRFIASLIFLYVVFVGLSSYTPSATLLSGAIIPWGALLYVVAVLGSIALFFASLFGLAMGSSLSDVIATKTSIWMPLALVVLTMTGASASALSVGTWTWYVLLGFVIGIIGDLIK